MGTVLHTDLPLRNMKYVEVVGTVQTDFTPWHVYGDQINEVDAEFPLHFLCTRCLNAESLFPEISPGKKV